MAKQHTKDPSAQPAADDAHAFRAAVRDVKPLAHAPKPQGLAKPRARARKRMPAADVEDLDAVMPMVASADAAVRSDTLSFHRPGVRTGVIRRLRRGLYPLDAELDLHGLTQSVARDYLAQFLSRSRTAGARCVRIIHGKGYRSGTRGPVLKAAVDLWLRRHPDVLAFTSARALDGGTGALYVLLRS